MISANDRRRILAKLIHARHDLEDALAQHPVDVGEQIKCSRCGSLLPIFEGVTTVVQRPAYVARPAVSRPEEQDAGAASPQSFTRHWPEGLRVAMSDTCSKSG